MKLATIPSTWILEEGLRLDPRPYTGGAIHARRAILKRPHSRLEDLTAGFRGGIFTHLFSPKRTYVTDRNYGVPFLGASSMLLIDLGDLPLLSNRDAESRSYRPLKIRQGMTLISCSGSVGRMAYARADMDGMASAGDLLKVQPDPSRVPPGYVFAFLASSIGSQLVNGGTYGSIVQHLERQHIASIPVPRLGAVLEDKVHDLVESAATARVEATKLLRQAGSAVRALFEPPSAEGTERWSQCTAAALQSRMDAFYFSRECLFARCAFDSARAPKARLGEVARIFIPGIFKRKYADDPSFGYPYVTGGDVFQIRTDSGSYLMRQVAQEYELVVTKNTILIQEAGQLGGLIGKCVFVGQHLDGHAVSNNMVRVSATDPQDAGYLFAVLSTAEGRLLLSREAAGSSIPHLDAGRVSSLSVPWPDQASRRKIGELVLKASCFRDDACAREEEARALVEGAMGESV
ncbi:MAG: hypothetical protein GQE15_16505 [Archangiaceae bacterium]|nr:hypothetical protein [Archangiaceae bacterium]